MQAYDLHFFDSEKNLVHYTDIFAKNITEAIIYANEYCRIYEYHSVTIYNTEGLVINKGGK